MVDVLDKLNFPNELPHYYIGNGERKIWLNSLSVPNCKHPLRPTKVLNVLNSVNVNTEPLNSWAGFWHTLKGGLFIKRLPPGVANALTEHEETASIAQLLT